ncbi:MAG: serine hydrolase domain-containing protein [Gemmatimonas sp.]
MTHERHRFQTVRRAFPLTSLAIVLAVAVSACARDDASPRSSAIEAYRQRMLANPAADTVGGATVAVIVGDRVVWAEGFGWADRGKRIPASVETIYRIGSLTKTFTAVVLMQLVAAGTVQLDDPVEKYLPEIRGLASPRPGGKPVTLRMLASHTAGIIREPALPGAAAGPIAEWENKLLASIPTTAFDADPGTRYEYSNVGFGILGLTLSRAAKKPYMQMVEEGVLQPLGMYSSTFIIDERLQRWLSVGYELGASGIDTVTPALEHLGRGYKVPNGGIYSTVIDLARFMGALSGASKGVTTEPLRVMMETKQTPEAGVEGYGFGVQISQQGIVGHGGSVAGYTAQFDFDPATKIGVIVLSNGRIGNGSGLQLLQALVQEMRGGLLSRTLLSP